MVKISVGELHAMAEGAAEWVWLSGYGAGHSTYPLFGSSPTWFEAQSLGFLWVEIDGRTLTGVFYDEDGIELFRQTMTK